MVKQRLKKGEGQKRILEAIENKWLTRKEIEKKTGLNYSTIDEAFKVLVPSKVEKSETTDINDIKITKYRSKLSKEVIDPEYLKSIINNIESGIPEKVVIGKDRLIALGGDKYSDWRILDKTFIDFIIKNLKKNYKSKQSWDYDFFSFEEIFDTITLKLKKDIDFSPENSEKQVELLEYIKKKLGNFFKEILLDNSSSIGIKRSALDNLKLMSYPNIYDITFNSLKTLKFSEDIKDKGFYFDTFRSLILDYAKINPADCTKRLWEAYNFQKSEEGKRAILYLLNLTSLGYIDEEFVYKKYYGKEKTKIYRERKTIKF